MPKKTNKGDPGERRPVKSSVRRGDTTQKYRIARRRAQLNKIAQAAGYTGWSAYETAVINHRAKIPATAR